MSHFIRIFVISSLLLLVISGSVMQSVADPAKQPVLISKAEQEAHIEKMKSMTQSEKIQYRNEQYELLRKKAAAIGYEMPETPPWSGTTEIMTAPASDSSTSESDQPPAIIATESRHQEQLEKYRKAAAEKRQAMQERLEKQRQSIKQRIDRLVEQNAVKTAPEQSRMVMPPPPPAFAPAPGYAPGPAFGPAYPGYYRVPPPMRMPPPGYFY